jgi:uncharacterized membrane protein YhiD involved in acid resistance
MVAAIGVAVGLRAYVLALIGTLLALVVLEAYRWAERHITRDAR